MSEEINSVNIGKLLKDGKTKRIYETDNPDEAVLYFKDEAIAFNGLKRGRILGKGEVNNEICAYIFPRLTEYGIPNHFIRRLDQRQSLVKRCQMIPISVIVRNVAAGSLTERLGIPQGTQLKPKVVEFHLRNTLADHPLINFSHIDAMGLATREETELMREEALHINELLHKLMKEVGVELIDLKLRFGRFHGQLLVADEITPDTCRLWDAVTHEPMDIDRFREDMDDVAGGYQELLHRMMGHKEGRE